MPGDPAVLEGAPAALTTADLFNAVVVKLPPFWPDNIKTLLVRLNLIMSQTDAVKVLDLIRTPPADNPYCHFKEPLLWMYSLTDNTHYKAITSLPLSRDMLPLALMSKMHSLLPSGHEACFSSVGLFSNTSPQMFDLT